MVERLFALLKKWRFLRYEHSINFDPLKVHRIFVIICGFHNAFGRSLYSDETQQNLDVDHILNSETADNVVARSEAQKTRGWKGQTADSLNVLEVNEIIPHFDVHDLRRLAGGPYQLTLAIPYYRHSPTVKFMRHDDCPCSIRTDGIVSRHSRNDVDVTRYKVYHRFSADGDFMKTLSFCTCNVGMGTSSLCAHAVASLYMLRHVIDSKSIPRQHPRTDSHFDGMIDLFYWKWQWKALRDGDSDDDEENNDGDNVNALGIDEEPPAKRRRLNSNSNGNVNRVRLSDLSDIELDIELSDEESSSDEDIDLDISLSDSDSESESESKSDSDDQSENGWEMSSDNSDNDVLDLVGSDVDNIDEHMSEWLQDNAMNGEW